MIPRTAVSALALGIWAAAVCAQTEMTVTTATESRLQWGTSRTERYDIAFRLADSSLAGSGLKRIEIPFEAVCGTSGHTIWMSRTLSLENGINCPDMFEIAVDPAGSSLSAEIPDGLSIPEGECFIGFSFSVDVLDDASRMPVTVAEAPAPGDMYVHTSRKFLRWGTQNLTSTPVMALTLCGNFHDDAVAVVDLPEAGALRGSGMKLCPVIRNHGASPVSSLSYTVETAGSTTEGHMVFDPPLPSLYFCDVSLEIDMAPGNDPGAFPCSFSVTDVNGRHNPDPSMSRSGDCFIYPYLPEKIPLMEEYTGTWCGWCPRGIVGMEKMTEAFPDKFIYAAYHRGDDPMNTVEMLATPYEGAPSGYLDRVVAVDPFYGTSGPDVTAAADGIGKAWESRCAIATTGEISASARWTGDAREEIAVESTSTFVRDYCGSRFRLVYLLTCDGLAGEGKDWSQSNYFSGMTEYDSTELSCLVERPGYIADMVYDGVVVMSSSPEGVAESLPAQIRMLEPITHSYGFKVADARNLSGDTLPIDKDKLHVIAAIADSFTGEIVNCCRCGIADDSGADMPADDSIEVWTVGSEIIISGITEECTVSIYDPCGKIITRTVTDSGIRMRRPATRGLYILNIGGKCHKLLL